MVEGVPQPSGRCVLVSLTCSKEPFIPAGICRTTVSRSDCVCLGDAAEAYAEEDSFLCPTEVEGLCREDVPVPPYISFLSLFFLAIVSSIRFLADLCNIFFAEASTS